MYKKKFSKILSVLLITALVFTYNSGFALSVWAAGEDVPAAAEEMSDDAAQAESGESNDGSDADLQNNDQQELPAYEESGDPEDIRERFGAKILGRLRSDTDALKQENGDVLLIGTEEREETHEATPAPCETECEAEETEEPAEDSGEEGSIAEAGDNPAENVQEDNAEEQQETEGKEND